MATPPRPVPQQHPALAAALKDCRRAFWSVAIFSGFVNLMMLAGPIYMLQIYDRVLSSRSVPTLVASDSRSHRSRTSAARFARSVPDFRATATRSSTN